METTTRKITELQQFANFFMKRNTESVSYSFETDSVFRFIKKLQIFLWNGIQHPFHTVLKRILYFVSHTSWIPNNPFKQSHTPLERVLGGAGTLTQ